MLNSVTYTVMHEVVSGAVLSKYCEYEYMSTASLAYIVFTYKKFTDH